MDLIYRGIGVPAKPRNLMIDLLGDGIIDVRTAFGQGSILSILHIAFYMDCLQEQLADCPDPVEVRHHQTGGGIEISSTLFVDDQLDITTSLRGIQASAKTTNIFMGKAGTGGVFGAEKSFMMYLTSNNEHFDAVQLNDGLGIPREVKVVSPEEGFKHLGVYQRGDNLWEATITPTWVRLTEEADRIVRQKLSLVQFRYIVNSVWIPRLRYRMVLGGAIGVAGSIDTFIRQVARSVLRLPHSTPRSVYYDKFNGLGLLSCELDANVHRYNEAVRILNSPDLPVYHLLVESLEMYQVNAGLTENPLRVPIKPPVQVTTWAGRIIRFAAAMTPPLKLDCKWKQPPAALAKRSNDRPLLHYTRQELRSKLVAVNWNTDSKLQLWNAATYTGSTPTKRDVAGSQAGTG
ncbi:hypothetical protein PHYSODRAFT_315490 [Phytophthora sojae]|uniref:Reverse transcriptase domain-containing protein n=1 Tax=Phytophthora sojae (strain P6497) TaxID=1094619 RepID=G4ZLN2_PHYSP|nr:hypothetical protein PHYSODRAFT_315490 [Phytophthora sojae]EGZ14607.1 hypothetical protein PHYSODRAFT_315490 [Phytophthora sojae]|eukprot:XP_009528356.1 hypothetical protein PHYSODRAFT_315490 [Phytophthora sojae]